MRTPSGTPQIEDRWLHAQDQLERVREGVVPNARQALAQGGAHAFNDAMAHGAVVMQAAQLIREFEHTSLDAQLKFAEQILRM